MPTGLHCKLFLGATLAAFALISTASAEPKPDIAIKTKAAEITVAVDAALKRHPGLAADCLAEGRRWAEKSRAEADKSLRDDPTDFTGGRRWSLERGYSVRSVVARYVSILRTDYTYSGGAHPNTNIDTILWDRDARTRISIRPFLKESTDNGPTMTALAKLVRLAVAREKIERGQGDEDAAKKKGVSTEEYLVAQDSSITDGVQASLIKLGPVTLAPSTVVNKSSGFTFHFSPYAVGSYAEGPYTVFVPGSELKPYLSPTGAAIFAGERPEGDDTQ
jgi:Deacetylase PdaC